MTHFIPEPRNYAEVTKLADNERKPWIIATLKEIKNLINNMTFMIDTQIMMNQSLLAWMSTKPRSDLMAAWTNKS